MTMRMERILSVLDELSARVGGCNTTMDTLYDDFAQKRRASMQIRKDATRCRQESRIAMERFLAIVEANKISKDSHVVAVFFKRRTKFHELERFFL